MAGQCSEMTGCTPPSAAAEWRQRLSSGQLCVDVLEVVCMVCYKNIQFKCISLPGTKLAVCVTQDSELKALLSVDAF